MEKSDRNKQKELNKLFKFLGVNEFTPPSINIRRNSGFTDKERKKVKGVKNPIIRKAINALKSYFRRHPRLYYTLKRNFHFDYIYQLINHNL